MEASRRRYLKIRAAHIFLWGLLIWILLMIGRIPLLGS
jgi:hypothetical protein